MKFKFILIITLCCFIFSACTVIGDTQETKTHEEPSQFEPIRAMWLSCYELQPMFSAGTSEFFSSQVTEVFEICRKNQINTLFVQVRPFCDSLYPSELFDWSEFALSSSGDIPDYDPLAIIVTEGEKYGVSIHAWINPYRVSFNHDTEISEKIKDFAFICDQGVYLEPSSIYAQKLVLDGVRELLENYNLDGIHIDDYFYPLTEEPFDENIYLKYCEQGGRLTKNAWRRENVNSLVGSIYALVHSVKKEAVFSISPAGDIDKNFNNYFADTDLWMNKSGYADWIIPQIYFGFEHETMPFEYEAEKWINLCRNNKVKLVCGLASYKQGEPDRNAGKGENEWLNSDDIIRAQADCAIALGYAGYALFSYSSVK